MLLQTITAELAKSANSKCDIFTAGHRKSWIEGSDFGSADRIGFCVDMDKRICDIFKNGERIANYSSL